MRTEVLFWEICVCKNTSQGYEDSFDKYSEKCSEKWKDKQNSVGFS